MFVNFKSRWFQAYCRALFEDDPIVARLCVQDALLAIQNRTFERDVSVDERDALSVAARYLAVIQDEGMIKPA
jgi:hypothetical protein